MASPHPDEALDTLFARYVPGSMLDSHGTAELVAHARRLRVERNEAVEHATFLCECAAKLLYGGDALIEEVVENAHDDLQRQLRRMFDPLRLSDVMNRYVPGDEADARATRVAAAGAGPGTPCCPQCGRPNDETRPFTMLRCGHCGHLWECVSAEVANG